MDIATLIAIIALIITILSNVVSIAIYSARKSAGLEALKASFKEFKKDIQEKIKEARQHTDEHIKRLEEKQDKHNSVIERMAIVEQSVKSAHHRIDDIKGGKK